MIKKLAIEFTNGVRRELTLIAKSIPFIGEDLEPILMGAEPDIVTVTDTTQELSAKNLVTRFVTGAAASVATIEDGLYIGQRLTVQGTLGTGGDALALTSGTGILASSNSAPLTNLIFNADDEYAILEWRPAGWQVVHTTATETA